VRITPLLALVLGSPLLVACSTAPVKLKYVQYEDETREPRGDYSGLTKFSLAKSILVVRREAAASAGQLAPATMTAVPAEATSPRTHFGVQQESPGANLLTISKLDNSNLVHRLASSNAPPASPRPSLTAVAGSVDLPDGSKALSLPLAIDTERLLDQANRNALTRWGVTENSNRKVAFEVAFEAVPKDAIDTRLLDLSKASQLYFYSACRTATVTFLSAPLTRQQFTVTLADPHFVQTIALANQGTITSHSGCGVDVRPAVAETADELKELNQAIAQARSLNGAWVTSVDADKSSALAAATASNRAAQKAVKAAATAAAVAEQKKRDEALRNAEVQVPRQQPARETFAF